MTHATLGALLLLSVESASAAVDLSWCADPLLFRDSNEALFDCAEYTTAEATMPEVREVLGDPGPLGFCMPQYSSNGVSLCTGSCNGGIGCPGSLQASQLVINPTGDLICGHYGVEIPDIDVQYLTVNCNVRVTAQVTYDAEVDGTYLEPLTWEILGVVGLNQSVSNVEIDGCAGIAGAIFPIIAPLVEQLVTEVVEDFLQNLVGVGVCPVDSMHEDLILP
jgi:hypothetical protein